MATPTPMKHALSQQGRTPLQQGQGQGRTPSHIAAATPPPGSTPFSSSAAQVAFSPHGPRSSPQQVRKSPATAVAMVGQLSNGPLNFDSPSAAAALGAFGLGNGLDLELDQVGGVGGLGGLGAFGGEDDKLKRLDAIIDILNKKKGIVSEAGLERLAQHIGFESLSEESTSPDGRKKRTLILAGNLTSLDIVLDNNIVEKVTLGYPGSADSVARHMEPASGILLRDLQLRPNQSPLTKTLDRFAANLERLANWDHLSILPALDCREALAGLHSSLERLYEWDLARLREDEKEGGDTAATKDADVSIARLQELQSQTVMCTRHGRPRMHDRDRVGLALQYWQSMHHLLPVATISPNNHLRGDHDDEKIWLLLISCAPLDGSGILPIRSSAEWLPLQQVAKEDPLEPNKMVLDWQEPPNITLPASEENKDASMELLQPDLSVARVPQVMFTATFDPPVILPRNDWAKLYGYAGISPPETFGYPPTFDGLFFPLSADGDQESSSESRVITRRRQLRVFDRDGTSTVVNHRNALFIYKQIYSQTIRELPFSHPSQLVQMLPLLRQYAFMSVLLRNSFCGDTEPAQPTKTKKSEEEQIQKQQTRQSEGSRGSETHQTTTTATTINDELAAFMDSGRHGASIVEQSTTQNKISNNDDENIKKVEKLREADNVMNLDVTVWVHPSPHLQIVFPFKESTANITLHVLENGRVEVSNENILSTLEGSNTNDAGDGVMDVDVDKEGDKERKKKPITREGLAKVLERMEDLCKWAEWIRTRVG